jgi:hypothetical protein
VVTALVLAVATGLTGCGGPSHAQGTGSTALDQDVLAFRDHHRGAWRDLNVPNPTGDHLETVPDGTTTMDTSSAAGISITSQGR